MLGRDYARRKGQTQYKISLGVGSVYAFLLIFTSHRTGGGKKQTETQIIDPPFFSQSISKLFWEVSPNLAIPGNIRLRSFRFRFSNLRNMFSEQMNRRLK